jgi:hypothetical protein
MPDSYINATVAQLVEQLIRNQQVDGSNPPRGCFNWGNNLGSYQSTAFKLVKGSR